MSEQHGDGGSHVESEGHDGQGSQSPSSSVCYLTEEMVDPLTTDEDRHTPEGEFLCDSDSTPRSEVPCPSESASAQLVDGLQGHEPNDHGYFSPRPVRYFPGYLPGNRSSNEASPLHSATGSTTSVDAVHPETRPASALSFTPSESSERPSVHRDPSDQSTTSTIRAPSADILLRPQGSRIQTRDYPHPTDQSHSSPHAQLQFSPQHPLSFFRNRTSHPTIHNFHSSSLVHTLHNPRDPERVTDSGSKTVGNSPISSPGPFHSPIPQVQSAIEPYGDHDFYSSPYLHYSPQQQPKETHKADVDVDPISGRKLINNYEIIDELGRGVHGKVKLGRDLDTGQNVAIKIIERFAKKRRLGKSTSHQDKIKREIAILKKARHPNIVSLLEVIDDPGRKKVYIVLEHVEMGEIKWRVLGAKEICLIEYRRIQREREGIFDSEAEELKDQKILFEANQRRRRRERRELLEYQRHHPSGTDLSASISEDGGEVDFSVQEAERNSSLPAASLNSGHDEQGQVIDQEVVDESLQTVTPGSLPATTEPHMETARRDGDIRPSPSDDSLSRFPLTGLEGTMYGPYDSDIPRGRTPSVAGSATSVSLESMAEDVVPEHFKYVPTMTIASARAAFRDTVLGVEYLHYQGVIHRDIKPANLLQTKDHRTKISDFGVSYVGRGPAEAEDQSESEAQDVDGALELAKTVGTPAFYAPELCQTDPDAETLPVTGQIDIWALGVTLYCLIFGRVPFHDVNTFALMNTIATEEVYIPRKRLKAVDEHAGSRPSSHSRIYRSMNSNKRASHELEYEEIDDELFDLMKRLFVKDPRKRIKLTEVKHHPWLLHDLGNHIAWLEETDPSARSEGKKIEVSKEDVQGAVVTMIERVRSGVRRTLNAIGIGKQNPTVSRSRAKTINAPDSSRSASAASTSSHFSQQEARRPSLKPEDLVYTSSHRAPREEHPLSHSQVASPEEFARQHYFQEEPSRPESPQYERPERRPPAAELRRPSIDRFHSTSSSVKTIRASDVGIFRRRASPTPPPGLPNAPLTLEMPGSTSISGLLGAGRRMIKTVRSRDRESGRYRDHARARSIDPIIGDDDAHGEPSIAFSKTHAAGHVDPPESVKDGASPGLLSPTLSATTPRSPELARWRRQSTAHSRNSSVSSIASGTPNTASENPSSATPIFAGHTTGSTDEQVDKARDELMRRQVREARSRATQMEHRRPPSALSQGACPPSPDDDDYYRRRRDEALREHAMSEDFPSLDTSPQSYPASLDSKPITASSSEDQFTSGLSQSTSNPSIPSAISAESSIVGDDGFYNHKIITRDTTMEMPLDSIPSEASMASTSLDESDRTVYRKPKALAQRRLAEENAAAEDYDGYDGDHDGGDRAIESGDDDDDDSDSDDGVLMMGRPKPARHPGLARSESITIGQLQHQRRDGTRRTSELTSRAGRSGSHGTVKKVATDDAANPVDVAGGSDDEVVRGIAHEN